MSNIQVEKPDEGKLKAMGIDSWGIWECEPSTFPWHYDDKETCYFLEGRVKVKTADGEVEIGRGDLVVFPRGLDCTWEVVEKVKKHYRFG